MTYVTGVIEGGRLVPPDQLADLLERPLVASLATLRPDGTLQCNPMWFAYDGQNLRFSHTTDRQKWHNMSTTPTVSLAIIDPDNPFRYLEVRGDVVDWEPDQDASFHKALRQRYGMAPEPVPDADTRIVITVAPSFIGGRDMKDPTRRGSKGKYH